MGSEAKPLQKVLVLGGTGLVGTHLVELAATHPAVGEVVAPVRRIPEHAVARPHPKVHWVGVDFDQLEEQAPLFAVDIVLCALGTTLRKAGSREAFEAVDLELPLRAARFARKVGVARLGVISSIGANSKSPSFYTRTKGRLEEGLVALHFDVLVVARPSLLLGDRSEKRVGEDLAKAILLPVRRLVPRTWRPIEAGVLARKLLDATLEANPGTRVLDNAFLHE